MRQIKVLKVAAAAAAASVQRVTLSMARATAIRNLSIKTRAIIITIIMINTIIEC